MINELATQVYEQNKLKGFWDDKKNKGEMLMLIVSELAGALEADRKGRVADTTYIREMIKDGYTWKDSEHSFTSAFQRDIKDTFEDEIADTVIRLLDLAGGLDIDLDFHIRQKLAYNKTRPFKHGKKY